MAIYSCFSHYKWWFSIVFCMFIRVYPSDLRCAGRLTTGHHGTVGHNVWQHLLRMPGWIAVWLGSWVTLGDCYGNSWDFMGFSSKNGCFNWIEEGMPFLIPRGVWRHVNKSCIFSGLRIICWLGDVPSKWPTWTITCVPRRTCGWPGIYYQQSDALAAELTTWMCIPITQRVRWKHQCFLINNKWDMYMSMWVNETKKSNIETLINKYTHMYEYPPKKRYK